MSRFYGEVEGMHRALSRRGSAKSGLRCSSWGDELGIETRIHPRDADPKSPREQIEVAARWGRGGCLETIGTLQRDGNVLRLVDQHGVLLWQRGM